MTERHDGTEIPAVVFVGVSKSYSGQYALRVLDLEIKEGEFFCLLGPSGCGKTTTLNLLGGFVEPSTGCIELRGQRIDRLPPHKRPVNTVFQSYALFPHMTVRDNVGFGLRMAKVPKAEARRRVDAALDQVGLGNLGDRHPPQLSGGQQQRVAVARALVNRPAVLILDEPLGALDLKLRKRLQLELSQIHREVGTTFVYVTHDQEEAMSMADRIGVMNEGRLEQVATPAEIYRAPSTRFVADFIGESNFLDVTWDDREGLARLADRIAVPLQSDLVPGGSGALTMMVRPECVRPVDAGSGIPARVVQTSFLGDHARVTCELRIGIEVTLVLGASERSLATELLPGQELGLDWAPEDAVLFDSNNTNVTQEVAHVPITTDHAR